MPVECPDESQLLAFAVGKLPDAAFEQLARHVEQCHHCNEQLERIEHADQLLEHLHRLDSTDATGADVTPAWLARARNAAGSGVTSSSMNLDPGRRYARRLADGPCSLGRFELQAELGDGSFGYVFRAHDSELDRHVAIKIQRAGSLAGADEIRQFQREARSAAQLQHPGIVALYETGQTEDDVCFLVTEFVDGRTLESVMRNRPLTHQQIATMIAELADALQYAHDHDVVHRDIKPSNIIVDAAGRTHITDFGLAKRLAADQSLTSDGRIVGTPAYMSPEQTRGDSEEVNHRTDVYSLGVILYELLTGERPFQGNRRLLMRQVLEQDPRPLRQLDDHIPRDLETICLKAMSRSTLRRYQSASELAADLRRYLSGEPIAARPMSPLEKCWRWVRVNPIPSSLLVAVTVGSTVGFWYLSTLSRYFVEQTALDSARGEALMFEGVRDHYSERIIRRLDQQKVPVTLDWQTRDDCLPLPASYLVDVGDYISTGTSGMQVRLHGLHPWRPRPQRDDFQLGAMAALKERAQNGETDLSYFEFSESEGRPSLRYAKGQTMKQSCVDCHNSSSESPKRDWKVGDVVGILEVTRPMEREIRRTQAGLKGAFILMAGTASVLAGLSFALVLLARHRNRRKVA